MINARHIPLLASARRFVKRRDGEEGVTAVEFAILAFPMIMMMFGTIEFGLLLYAQSVMESATSNTSRLGKTGYSDSTISREQTLLNMLAQRTNPLLDADRFVVTTKVYPSFNSIDQAEPLQDTNNNGSRDAGENYTDVNGNGQWDTDMASGGLGNADDIVVYTITYPWPIMTPIMDNFIGNNGVFTLTARAVVKNEPYDDD